jgi:cell wall-associated NlpC family hydrolase
LCITALGGSMLVTSPSSADPKIADAKARVDTLYHQAEVASERVNEARERLSRAQARLQTFRADLDRKREQVEAVRRQVVSTVVAQSQGQVFSSATQVAMSDSPDAFLEQLVVVSQYNDQQNERKAEFAKQVRQLEIREEAAKRELTQIAQTKRELAEQKAKIDEKAREATNLLRRLKAEAAARAAERAAATSRTLDRSRNPDPAPAPSDPQAPAPAPTTPAPAPSGSGRAGAAVAYALSQVGDAYVWGATGPSAFDCSGLTLMAWSQAGVSLPHSAASQMSSGTPVSQSQLQPGDLVFYYSPVHHVGIYIGNGRIVHAANPSDGVLVAPLLSMPYSGAVRPG